MHSLPSFSGPKMVGCSMWTIRENQMLTIPVTVKTLLFAAAVTESAAASAIAVMPDLDVYADARLAAFCVIGSILGAFLSIAIFTPTHDTEANLTRRLAWKFFASLFMGLGLTPIVMEWRGYTLTASHVIGSSMVTAMLGVMVVHFGLPGIKALVKSWFK